MRHCVAWSIFAHVSKEIAKYIYTARVVSSEKRRQYASTEHWYLYTDSIFLPAERCSKILQNVCFHMKMHIASYPVRLGCSNPLLCELATQRKSSFLNLHGDFLYGTFSLRSLLRRKWKTSVGALTVAEPFHTLEQISNQTRSWGASGAPTPAAESKGRQKGATKWMFWNKEFNFLHLTHFKLLIQIKGN
jgi:hypothetical protein